MARLLRSTTDSVLRKPQAVNPPVVFGPVAVHGADPVRARHPEHVAHSKLRLPQAVGPAVIFGPDVVHLAVIPNVASVRRHKVEYYIQKPQIVGAPVVFGPDVIHLADERNSSAVQRRKVESYIQKPQATGPAVVFGGLELHQTRRDQRFFHARSVLIPQPQFFNVVIPPPFVPQVVVHLASVPNELAQQRRKAKPFLGKSVVGPPVVFPGPVLHQTKRDKRFVISRHLTLPAVIAGQVRPLTPDTGITELMTVSGYVAKQAPLPAGPLTELMLVSGNITKAGQNLTFIMDQNAEKHHLVGRAY